MEKRNTLDKEILSTISRNIKAERARAGLSQEETAKYLGIKRRSYIDKERLGRFKPEELLQLSKSFGCTIESFYMGL